MVVRSLKILCFLLALTALLLVRFRYRGVMEALPQDLTLKVYLIERNADNNSPSDCGYATYTTNLKYHSVNIINFPHALQKSLVNSKMKLGIFISPKPFAKEQSI